MLLPLFIYVCLSVFLIIQVNFSSDIFQSAYTFQTNETNSSSPISSIGQDDEDNRTSIFNQPEGSKANAGDLGVNGGNSEHPN